MAAEPYTFERRARSPKALALIALWWAVIVMLYLLVNANPWIILGLAAFSLPAIYDYGANTRATLTIDGKEITWRSGRRGARLPRGQLKSVRLDTRLDLSLKMSLITHQGGKTRLPYECIPSAAEIEAALSAQDIPYERHHFTLLS